MVKVLHDTIVEFKICTDCHVEHVENCPDCFGFGLKRTDPPIPISAHASKNWRDGVDYLNCSLCSGTPFGRQPYG